ncbi:hypothetical protein KUCAC02_013260 [Chaenocephalus aceratus]|nr:hypothetical protein KUCAC02_013260 [Chaenocephalus aceratus]
MASWMSCIQVFSLLLGSGQHLHHLRLLDARRDEEEAAFLVSDFPHDQLLEGDHRGALVLQEEEGVMERQQQWRERGRKWEGSKRNGHMLRMERERRGGYGRRGNEGDAIMTCSEEERGVGGRKGETW